MDPITHRCVWVEFSRQLSLRAVPFGVPQPHAFHALYLRQRVVGRRLRAPLRRPDVHIESCRVAEANAEKRLPPRLVRSSTCPFADAIGAWLKACQSQRQSPRSGSHTTLAAPSAWR
eukprot:6214357-Pleurochrysis_carterae.AAC.4